jgi:Flp pilus assembly protein TadD
LFQFEKASQISPEDYESNFNTGVAYRLAGKNDLAEIFYRRALKLRPEVNKPLFLSIY